MITVSIQGSCVLRDAIEFYNSNELVKVERFVQFINPMTMFGGRPILSKDIFNAEVCLTGVNFAKRCMKLDFQKTVFDYLAEVKSDYILLDISSLVMYYFVIEGGITFTESRMFLNNKEIVLSALDITKDELEKSRKGIFDLTVNDIKSVMKFYAKKILEMYKPEQVILVEIYMAEKYIDLETGVPVQWWNSMVPTHAQNCILKVAYEYLLEALGKVHTISFPKETYGNVNHKWGKYQRHYQDEYYKYLWDKMMKIMLE